MDDGSEYSDDERAELRTEMANSERLLVTTCPGCGYQVGFRAWPARSGELAAFLDGLAEVEAQTGVTVYGQWIDAGADLEQPGETTPVQLWRVSDRTMTQHVGMESVLGAMMQHRCPRAN